MRLFVLSCASIAALAHGSASDFPKDDSKHDSCKVNAMFKGYSCSELYDDLVDQIEEWDSDRRSPAGGEYDIKEKSKSDKYIWSTRLSRNKRDSDDILIELTSTSKGCTASGHSRSQEAYFVDYTVNFCNIWNIYYGTSDEFTYSVRDCDSPAQDPVYNCIR